MIPDRVFIGFDPNEAEAYRVCYTSIMETSKHTPCIQPLMLPRLRHAGIYRRQEYEENGQRYDMGDRKPFSTDFSFSRFLVPALCQYSFDAVFVDCDFVFMGDIGEIFKIGRENDKPVSVVQHQMPVEIGHKMGGLRQEPYSRKNWSSLIYWNNEKNFELTPTVVNHSTGRWLHNFMWLGDDDIGEIPEEWNWLVGLSPTTEKGLLGVPKAYHYTLGIPDLHDDAPEHPANKIYREMRDALHV